ncbi:MaoC/PaaZ C-terminal domain-containing protein (plasmid) [Embleya sp. NBC_00888]|uniref:MaoC family dehydratase n=1 Tax=Embleya sp. NBC_00888 TaxID=2975960 RepID=UPI002F90D751|nr:MaoC/PaaZ C-terminal domain-containing protein [Embleya sp. NBC_00888]
MPIDESLVGRSGPAVRRSWTADDAMLYAISVGAGQINPLSELAFTTENTCGHEQLVLPTFANVALGVELPLPDDVDMTKMLHAEQAFELAGTLATSGAVNSRCEIAGVYDKGSGALVETVTTAHDDAGSLAATLRTSVFFRGYGGFGGDRGPSSSWELPTRAPDHVVIYATRSDQALLYRLTGDRNPLHTDPSFSSRGGFERPILHGMCTYGYTGRALLHAAADSDPKRFRSMSGRFTKPIVPGETLTVSIWVDGETARFRTTDSAGNAVIDRGRALIG